jgi:protein-L-isoaspartate(D-aspartate) O-methyltransferase
MPDRAMLVAAGPGAARASRRERRRMVREQLLPRGITDRRVLATLAAVPREAFVAPHLRNRAYEDWPLPAGWGQTISQPFMVALMTQEAGLTRRARVLEIGTGTGYHTAVLSRLAGRVWTCERLPDLAREARARLERLGVRNVEFVVGDGAEGHAGAAPYAAIVVAAAAPAPPPRLLNQLDLGGRLVIPIGDMTLQDLLVFERTPAGFRQENAGACRFVPLVSPAAFPASEAD